MCYHLCSLLSACLLPKIQQIERLPPSRACTMWSNVQEHPIWKISEVLADTVINPLKNVIS